MYILKRWDWVSCEWHYFNTYRTYRAAAEAREEERRRYGGMFEIFEA